MVRKMARTKQVELDEIQSRVNSSEGESICEKFNVVACIRFVHMCTVYLCKRKSVKLCAFVRVRVMLYLSVHCVLCVCV